MSVTTDITKGLRIARIVLRYTEAVIVAIKDEVKGVETNNATK